MGRRRKKVLIGDERNPVATALTVAACILAPILGFLSAYPIMQLIEMIKGLF
jgi:hypothetical protein